jgi:hypothetical protein
MKKNFFFFFKKKNNTFTFEKVLLKEPHRCLFNTYITCQTTLSRMESQVLLRDKAKAACLDRRHGHKASSSCSCSCSSRDSRCFDKSAECLCSACLLCVCCPLALVWGCFKIPCKLGWRAAKNARRWACCGSEMRDYAAYSSFSDDDSDLLPSKKHTCSKTSAGPNKMVTKEK